MQDLDTIVEVAGDMVTTAGGVTAKWRDAAEPQAGMTCTYWRDWQGTQAAYSDDPRCQ